MRSILLAVLFLALALTGSVTAQQRWERTYGGADDDLGESVQQTTDGGYIVAGLGYGTQVCLIKTNSSGDTLWIRTYGGTNLDFGYSVQQTQDTGYIVTGYTRSFGNNDQVYLIKTNIQGDTLWTRTYGGAGDDQGYSVQQTSDGGYIVAGVYDYFGSDPQVYLIKTNASGDTLWTRTYGGANNDYGRSVQQTQDGGYVVVGYTYSFGNDNQVYLVKTDASGDTIWTKTYGGANSDGGNSVQQTQDGGYIIAGWSWSYGDSAQVYLIKTDSSGDTLWTRSYGGASFDAGYSVQQTTDRGYIVSGYTNSFGNGFQVNLIKTNEGGDTLWTGTYGGVSDDRGFSVHQASDRGYIVAGVTRSFGNGWQVYLIKTDSLGGSSGVEETTGVRGQRSENRLTATPNPFTSFASVPGHLADRFALYDVSGRRVGTYRGDRIGEGLRAGVYFLRTLEGKAGPVRIVKVR